MKNTVITVMFSLASTGCAFYAMAYPAWFYQHYRRDGNDVFQGYGIFAFYSTASLESPFYASETVLQYSDFCDSTTTPNYMLGDGDQFHKVLCGKGMRSVRATTVTGVALSVVGLVGSIIAVFNPSAGYSERVVSFCTLVSSLLLAISLVIWGWTIQQRLYQVDSINSAFTSCKADRTDWHCWFYGYSFWVCLASVIVLSITGYLSSAGRAEKIRYFRKEYERDLAVAVQQSMEHTTPAQAQPMAGATFVRSNTAQNFALNQQPYSQPPPAQYGQPQPYGQPQQFEQPYSQQQQFGAYNQQGGYPAQATAPAQYEPDAAYPAFREEKNHTLLGKQPSGGVV
uniref:MARVEL domain-containing protein n=1 Tax=Globisporangium ultimum (strain ATCC 200006 / CBS 805.95 / DAOM BR144) TaxID=431595 RepID=K3WQU2_GLOUD